MNQSARKGGRPPKAKAIILTKQRLVLTLCNAYHKCWPHYIYSCLGNNSEEAIELTSIKTGFFPF